MKRVFLAMKKHIVLYVLLCCAINVFAQEKGAVPNGKITRYETFIYTSDKIKNSYRMNVKNGTRHAVWGVIMTFTEIGLQF
jgi:hypothetical protein